VELLVGTTLNKKISYTNPYQTTRTFFLRTSHPWLVHFRPSRLELPSGSRRPVGLTFDGRGAPTGSEDVLIFVNDEEDKNEECFKIRLKIVDQ
jgi:nephrocystin-4